MATASKPINKKNMLLRHWYGEIPFANALGINDILIKLSYLGFLVLVELVIIFVIQSREVPHTDILVYTVQFLFLILFAEAQAWGVVGVWRNISNRVPSVLKKSVMIYCVVSTLAFALGMVVLNFNLLTHNLYLSSPFHPVACSLKPVIYLYPEKEQQVKVQLIFHGNLTSTYPTYDNTIHGWTVKAYPDGQLINLADHEPYSYLFWEGIPEHQTHDFSSGFLVQGTDTANFLKSTLKEIGLTPKEYNEFIVYWLPKMEHNKYNLIHFASKEYSDTAPLDIEPKPDSLLRVFMIYKPTDVKIEIKPQKITSFIRKGFTVVEWGGTELR